MAGNSKTGRILDVFELEAGDIDPFYSCRQRWQLRVGANGILWKTVTSLGEAWTAQACWLASHSSPCEVYDRDGSPKRGGFDRS